jgi:hypothetical protein
VEVAHAAGGLECHARAERSCIRQHTSAYVSIRQHTSAYVSIRQHTSAYVSIHASAERSCERDGLVSAYLRTYAPHAPLKSLNEP